MQEQQEVQSLKKLKHENIVLLQEVIVDRGYLHLVLEFLDQNVFELMKASPELFPESLVKSIVYQTLQGLAYMHK